MKLKMLKKKKWQWRKMKNLVSEAIVSKQDLAMKAGSFAKASVEKEIMLKYLNMAVEKLEEEFKLSRWFITFI